MAKIGHDDRRTIAHQISEIDIAVDHFIDQQRHGVVSEGRTETDQRENDDLAQMVTVFMVETTNH